MTKINNKAAVAGLLQGRMVETVRKGTSNPFIELGVLDNSMNLVLDGIANPVPDYMVCRQLTLGAKDEVLTKTKEDGKHVHNEPSVNSALELDSEHVHEVLIPEKMRKLKPGDRVLVAWASGTPVIVDIVLDKG